MISLYEKAYDKLYKENQAKDKEIENITILFHDTYEEVSKKYGYKTREDTKIFDIESPNGKTMYETVEKVVSPYLKEIERLNNIIDELENFIKTYSIPEFGEPHREFMEIKIILDKLKKLKEGK